MRIMRGFGFGRISSAILCVSGAAALAGGCNESSDADHEDSAGGATSGGAAGTSGAAGSGGTTMTGGSGGAATSGSGGAGQGGSTSTETGGTGAAGRDGATGGGGAGGDEDGGEAGGGGASGNGGFAGAGGSSVEGGPCDIYAAANPPTPCVAAYSMVRALSRTYSGSLYQVRKMDGATKDIPVLTPGGFANAAEQDAFCGSETCTVSVLYDQSGRGNHLSAFAPSCYQSAPPPAPSNESNARARSLTVSGHTVYALQTIAKDGYRRNQTSGMPVGSQAQGIYEVVDGTRYGSGCCWDFGNASTDNCLNQVGGVSALFFGTAYWGKGAGDGPWFMADFERGIWSGGSGMSSDVNDDNPSISYPYAMGILKTNATSYAIRSGNARSGSLVTAYDGALPFSSFALEGGIILGLAGDAAYSSYGTFFEGAITAGRPSDATDALILENVQAAQYGQ
jgi:hypothetical protein